MSAVQGAGTTTRAPVHVTFDYTQGEAGMRTVAPAAATLSPEPLRIACGTCVFVVLGLIIFGSYLLVLITSFTAPSLALVRAQALPAGTGRSPMAVDAATTTLRINWEFVLSIANSNSFEVDLYGLQYAAYPLAAATDLVANGTLASLRVPANSNNTEITILVLFSWCIREPTQSAF
ncbi:hypothetical protein H9P43_009125 [Blastocladiella emersonii ATCC 22665]|nr:hypothetical protein H9P43_009125 [Blastocladiella emersonii ATCC 22665]